MVVLGEGTLVPGTANGDMTGGVDPMGEVEPVVEVEIGIVLLLGRACDGTGGGNTEARRGGGGALLGDKTV